MSKRGRKCKAAGSPVSDESQGHANKRTRVEVVSSSTPASVSNDAAGHHDIFKVDKTLICRGFWEEIHSVGRIHLPRRFGKTYNLNTMRLFFSSSLELKAMQDIPDSVIEGGGVDGLTVTELCRKKREWLFSDSILKKKDTDFFSRHFCKHPIIYLSFAQCKGPSFVDLLGQLDDVMIQAFNSWLFDFEASKAELSRAASRAKQSLDYMIGHFEESRKDPTYVLGYSGSARSIFRDLSTLIWHHYDCRYIILADDYDVPSITVYQSNWSSHEQQDALTTLDVLFQSMFKDNNYLNKGLLAGIIPVMFGGISSGFNNYRDITMVPTDHSDLNFYSIVGSSEDNMARRDELVSSFGFNYSEVKSMVETVLTPYDCLCNRIDDVMRTIKQWYSGYQLGRFVGKYNPYSVCSYLTNLTKHIRPTQIYSDEDALELFKSCARNYWDLADSPGLIERQMEMYPSEFCTIARELVKEYAEYSSLDPSTSTSCETAVNLPYVKFRLSDTSTKYVNSGTFLSVALYTGYIAIRSPTTIGIPNGELWCVWESYLSQMNAKTSV